MDKNNFNPHAIKADEIIQFLETSWNGLSSSESSERLKKYGPNMLPEKKKKNLLLRFLSHFNDVLIYVLLAASVITAFLGKWIDTWIILGVVVINAFVGFLQEGKAEKAIDAVRNMLSIENRVFRDGEKITLPSEEIVPGDVVALSSGDRVPADMRLIQVHSLQINESSLTGESLPVSKNPEPVDPETDLADRKNMAYSGTIVTSGTAKAVVVATGENTEIGHINRMLSEVEKMTTPLLRQVNRFGIILSIFILSISATIFTLGFFVERMPLDELFMSVVAIAVAAIPEGLPAVISIILAIGVRRMAGRNAFIRHLPAVETLGSVSVICTDKTGTLTKNEMTVTRVLVSGKEISISGTGYAPKGELTVEDDDPYTAYDANFRWLVVGGSVCNESRLYESEGDWHVDGNPTEGSLLTLSRKAGIETEKILGKWEKIDEIPFESERKYMATLIKNDWGKFIFLKGASEVVLKRCSHEMDKEGNKVKINSSWWENRSTELAGMGFRILSIAMTEPENDFNELSFDHVENGLTLLGLTCIMDPARPEAIKAVEECRKAGIRVKMITGDHASTALTIARNMKITDNENVMVGREIEEKSDKELEELVETTDVYARVSPEHKLRLVKALQARGYITAMTGDGVNDAPALKKADIGISMGKKGTEASKEASKMVLADDNFASIVSAIKEGRTVYDNLKKTLLFILPTNGGEALVIIAAIALGMMIPLTPAQVLWVNMVTAVTLALTLAFEPMEKGIMERPPRNPDEPLVSRTMLLRIAYVSVLLMIGTLGIFTWHRAGGASISYARTIAVNTLIIGEIFYLFNSRYMHESSFSVKGIKATIQVWSAVAGVLLIQIPFTYLPLMQKIFDTAALGTVEWISMFAIGMAIFLVVELEKTITRKVLAKTE